MSMVVICVWNSKWSTAESWEHCIFIWDDERALNHMVDMAWEHQPERKQYDDNMNPGDTVIQGFSLQTSS